jgi:hypothetical protein
MSQIRLVTAMLLTLLIAVTNTRAQTGENRAVLVIAGDGEPRASCVRFSEPTLSGEQALRRADTRAVIDYQSQGAAICKIGATGCTLSQGCFCQCQTLGAGCAFWNYLRQRDEGWQLLPVGAGASIIEDGDVVAFVWATGDGESTSAQLPRYAVDAVCAAQPAARAPAVSSPTAAAIATAAAPSLPTPTAAITLIATPAAATPTTVATIRPTQTPSATDTPVPLIPTVVASPEAPAAANDFSTLAGFAVVTLGLLALIAVTRRRRATS